jgi:hypothetical protein
MIKSLERIVEISIETLLVVLENQWQDLCLVLNNKVGA